MIENELSGKEVSMAIEAALFAACAPISYGQIADVLGLNILQAKEACNQVLLMLEKDQRGIRFQMFDEKAQLTTAPETLNIIAFDSQFHDRESARRATSTATT